MISHTGSEWLVEKSAWQHFQQGGLFSDVLVGQWDKEALGDKLMSPCHTAKNIRMTCEAWMLIAWKTFVRTVTNLLVIWGIGLYSLQILWKEEPFCQTSKLGVRDRNKQVKALSWGHSVFWYPPSYGEPAWPTVSSQIKSSMLCTTTNSLSQPYANTNKLLILSKWVSASRCNLLNTEIYFILLYN